MIVEINIPPFFQHLTDNARTAEVSGSTVGEALEELAERFPQLRDKLFSRPGLLMKGLNVFVNGQSAYPEELAKPVHDGDKIHVTYVMVGG